MSEEVVKVKRKELTTSSRQAAFCALYSQRTKDGLLERGALQKTAKMFSVDSSTMGRLWRDTLKRVAEKNKNNNETSSTLTVSDILTNTSFFETRRHDRGRKKKWDRKALKEAVEGVDCLDQKTFRKLSTELKVPKSTLHDLCKKEGLFPKQSTGKRPAPKAAVKK